MEKLNQGVKYMLKVTDFHFLGLFTMKRVHPSDMNIKRPGLLERM